MRKPKRHGSLLALLGLLILVEVLTVFAVLASQRFATERALREYSHDLLTNVVDETRENAIGYLRQAQDAVVLTKGVLEAGLIPLDDPPKLEPFLLEQLRVISHIDALYYGDRHGNFVFTKRNASDGGYLSKLVRSAQPKESRVTFINRDDALDETARRFEPTDPYDPRERPWYRNAQASSGPTWTEPYIFYTSRQPGLTVAMALHDSDGQLLGVVGADLELSAISDFLRTQRVGTSGAAFIIDREANVLAHPRTAPLSHVDDDNGLRLKRLDELDDISAHATVKLAYLYPDLNTLSQPVFDKFVVGDTSYLSMFVSLLAQDRNRWIMGVYAPEDELAQKIREGQRESIVLGVAMSLLVVTAAVMIGLIMLQPINTLQREASEDPLTGLLNRRGFDDIAARRLASAQRQHRPISALMIDIDHFKVINDQHGHGAGDEVLLAVARRLGSGLSNRDLLSRHGGEEFAVLLPDTPLEQGLQIAERLRLSVGESPIKTTAGEMTVTISIGVAEHDDSDVAALLDRADQGLLAAKRAGRDRVATI